jgi:dihydrofolate reductase
MRRVILDLAVSLDGFIEGPNGEIDWCIMDDDMDFEGFLSGIDVIFFGRMSYEAWVNYLPAENASELDRKLNEMIQSKEKYVFSNQIRQIEGVKVIHSKIDNRVEEIKNQSGKDIWLFGGASIIKTFIHLRLIDQYRISVHPTVLGSGKALFGNIKDRINLKLMAAKQFRSGVVQLIYENK